MEINIGKQFVNIETKEKFEIKEFIDYVDGSRSVIYRLVNSKVDLKLSYKAFEHCIDSGSFKMVT